MHSQRGFRSHVGSLPEWHQLRTVTEIYYEIWIVLLLNARVFVNNVKFCCSDLCYDNNIKKKRVIKIKNPKKEFHIAYCASYNNVYNIQFKGCGYNLLKKKKKGLPTV